jgi:hypothetical protein
MRKIALSLMMIALLVHPAAAEPLPDGTNKEYAAVLAASVKDGKVDYAQIARSYGKALDGYLMALAGVDVAKLDRADQLAYYINLYNATMLKAVNERGGKKSFKPSDDKFSVFDQPRVHTKADVISLNDLENKIIRPTFKDPRVHAALCCGAVSCPPLIEKPYEATTLDAQLDSNVKNWLADKSRNEINDGANVLKLSKIFDWYAADFGGKENVAKWVSSKLGRDVSSYKVEFVEYDWSLNSK